MAEYDDTYVDGRRRCNRAASIASRCDTRPVANSACGPFWTASEPVAFTDTFEDLHGLEQLPGLAVQRLMADGYGFGAEGDWKTAALVRVMKTMTAGLPGGTSFMEDYTYHLRSGRSPRCWAHTCWRSVRRSRPTRPSCEIHPLGIGGKEDPVRLVFTAPPGPAINVAMIDLGDRFRMLVNEVDAVTPEQPLPKLPVARALWTPRPDLKTAAAAWIYAGGPHHTVFSQAATSEQIEDFAEMVGHRMSVHRPADTVAGFQATASLKPVTARRRQHLTRVLGNTSRGQRDGNTRLVDDRRVFRSAAWVSPGG